MRIFLEPAETLLFRTGRPFDAGESGFAETLFPPTPETVQGAIRAAIASNWDRSKSLEEIFSLREVIGLIGDRNGYGRFRITGFSLGKRTEKNDIERLFPVPTLVLQVPDKRGRTQIRLRPQLGAGMKSDLPDNSYYLFPDQEPKEKIESPSCWLTEGGLKKVLRTDAILTEEEFVEGYRIYEREPRLGIGMDNATKVTKEGLLYQVQMIRMKQDYGFVIDIRLSDSSGSSADGAEQLVDDNLTQGLLRLPDRGLMTMGGESRTVHFEVVKPTAQSSELEQRTRGRLIYLSTPAAFDKGWQPEKWTTSSRPITAAINRYQPIGGWALDPKNAGGHGKEMRRCVPAGSVYFFDQEVSVPRPFTEYGKEIGYGIAYTGEWQ